MTFLQRFRRLIGTKGMFAAYMIWLAHSLLGIDGPFRKVGNNCRIGSRWANFSEYWTYRVDNCGGIAHPGLPAGVLELLRVDRVVPGDSKPTAVDVGANVGLITILMAGLGYEVHAFEPIPETCRRLKANLEINEEVRSNAIVNECALSDREGVVTMTGPGHSPATAFISRHPGNGTDELVRVRTTTLDNYAEGCGLKHIDFLKVDVEGYEPAVFLGAQELLARKAIRTIYFEWSPNMMQRAGFEPAAMLDRLAGVGYQLFDLDKNGTLHPLDACRLLEACRDWDNIVARAG